MRLNDRQLVGVLSTSTLVMAAEEEAATVICSSLFVCVCFIGKPQQAL